MPERVRANEKRLRQIFMNLPSNVIKFTARGQVTFRLRDAREMAHLEIEDNGPGMGQAELAQIFEPFTRGGAAGAAPTGAGGVGLGLTIARMLTDLMGGEMTVVSTPGVGSVFRVRLFLPGIDGWETLRRIRAAGHTGIQLAAVSANAFDKTLDNVVSLPTDDFILKPMWHSELLGWREKCLGLHWLRDAPRPRQCPRYLRQCACGLPPRRWRIR